MSKNVSKFARPVFRPTRCSELIVHTNAGITVKFLLTDV